MRTVASCVVALAIASALTFAQDPQRPSFKAGVQLVRIDVSVLDEKRQPVRGLQASDFTVLEDGQARPVRAFRFVDHAATSAAAETTATASASMPDVATNRAGDDTSRLIFILMDRSIPPERPMLIARQIADAAVDAMGPGDLAAIVTTGGGVPQNLTSDRARLHKTIAAADWSQQLSQAQLDDPIVGQVLGLGDTLGDPRCMCGLCVMDTIARIANDVRDVPRRKVLLFVGSNIIVQAGPRAFSADVGCEKRVEDSRAKLYDALGTSGLTVHSIDPQGLATVGPATRASVPNGIENRDGRTLNTQLTQETMDLMAKQGNLGILPELTGGRTVLNSNEPFRMVPDVLHESDAYYLLAFEPLESTGEVRHKIEVKVARKGVAVHTARFIAPRDATAVSAPSTPTSPLDRALTELLPDASLPLGMAVASFAGPDPKHAYVGITLDASSFATAEGSLPLEIAVLASDERGRRVGGARQTGTVQVPRSASAGTPALLELQTYLALPPGDYELRAAVMHAGTQAASSVFTHITVPSFDDGSLTLSDVVLGTHENAGGLPDGAPEIPIVPTTTRAFGANETAWAFVRLYRRSADDATPVSVDISVLDSTGTRVSHRLLGEASFSGRQGGVRLGLPLKTLPAGRYTLQFEAKQGHAERSRSIAFTVAQALPSFTQEHSPALDAALAAAARYIEQYEQRISAIGAEELYEQVASGPVAIGGLLPRPGLALGARTTVIRKTRANIMTLSLGARGWVSFRDVFEIDGRPVRDREERLSRILQNVTPDSLEQARQIAVESARYNLEPEGTRVDRTINVPMTALLYLRAANQARSAFRLGKTERIAGVDCVTLQFTEQSRPRLIRTNDDAPAYGTFWIDLAGGGRIVKTELRMESAAATRQIVRTRTTVTYALVDKLSLWVPTVMDESYDLPATTLTGRATYSDFREFKVTTSEGIR